MALGTDYPVFKSSELKWAFGQTGHPAPSKGADEGETYEHALKFFDRLIECSTGMPANRLEAESLVWWVCNSELPKPPTPADDPNESPTLADDLNELAAELMWDVSHLRKITRLLRDKRQVNMNELFQGFVTQALRESLGVTEHTLRSDDRHLPSIYLDQPLNDHRQRLLLEPDLTWWDGDICTFVGDAKYKRIDIKAIPNADVYQILAYATALDLPVYAKGEAEPVEYAVRHGDKRLEVATIDLAGSIEAIRSSVDRLAVRVCKLRDEARIRAIAA